VFFSLLVPNICPELLPVPPPVLQRPFWLGLEIDSCLYSLRHLQTPKTYPIAIGLFGSIPPLVATFLLMASATPKRGVGETSLIGLGRGGLFLGCIQALAGAGGTYEDEKAAFALSLCIGSFRGAISTTPRLHTPSSCGEKNLGRNHGTQIEHLRLHRAWYNDQHTQTFINPDRSSHLTSNVHDPFGSRSLSEAKSNVEYLWLWPISGFGLDIR